MAFYQPDIAANFGAGLRLAACFGLDVDVIEPCGFPLDDRRLRRAAMDYGVIPNLTRHPSFSRFYDANCNRSARTVLLSRHADVLHHEFKFRTGDVLLAGRETSGVPESVNRRVDQSLRVAMNPRARSLNVITALAVVTGEALRQLGWLDKLKGMEQQ